MGVHPGNYRLYFNLLADDIIGAVLGSECSFTVLDVIALSGGTLSTIQRKV